MINSAYFETKPLGVKRLLLVLFITIALVLFGLALNCKFWLGLNCCWDGANCSLKCGVGAGVVEVLCVIRN